MGNNETAYSQVGKRIREARIKKGMTQEALATAVDLSKDHISIIERGMKILRLDSFIRIANALEVSSDTLLSDVVEHSAEGRATQLGEMIRTLPGKEQWRILLVVESLLDK